MKGEDYKFPIPEDCPNLFNKEKNGYSLKHKKLLIAAWFLLLSIMSIMIGFTFRSLTEISQLKGEVEALKSTVQVLQKRVSDLDNPEYNEDTVFLEDNHHYDDDYYDISYDDDISEGIYDEKDTFPENTDLLTGKDFTKDAKTTEVLPRSKRNIIGYNQDEVPINSGTYEGQRRKNNSHHVTTTPPRSFSYPLYSQFKVQQDLDNHLTSPTPRQSNMAVEDNKRRVPKMSSLLKSGDSHNSRENPDVDFTIITDDQMGSGRTRHRQRRLELDERPKYGRMHPLPTAHFNGDTSKYVYGQHQNFDGNGRLRHPQRTFVDWVESSWFHSLEMDRHFSFSDGVVTVKESGLYFIYAQIFYLDEHDTNGFRVYKNESETILHCTTMTHSEKKVLKSNTCFTASAEYLEENDSISLADLSDSRYSLFEPGKSFFGIIKLGDVKIRRRK